ncbi:hypothetical protein LPJ70_000404 [Coemansia sp. RSA 2708]|nr:hypothetical protein LPJ70_000404 [Coemansia sp. RSA 2708]
MLMFLHATTPGIRLNPRPASIHNYHPAVHHDAWSGFASVLFNKAPPPSALSGQQSNLRRCSDIPIPDSYWTVQDASAPAFVTIPSNRRIGVDDTVCVRVVVPAKPTGVFLAYAPFPNTPWDSVLVDLVGEHSKVSVPVHLQPVKDVRNTYRDSTHIYEADVRLRDVDVYRATGYIEFRGGEWNCEGGLAPVDYNPELLYISEMLTVEVSDPQNSSPYSLDRYMDLPLCTELDSDGRWVMAAKLPFEPHNIPLPDNHGMVWLPYMCRLRRMAYTDYTQCLATRYPMMHWFGDSNLRRALKKLTTLGRWCQTGEEQLTRPCICEDYKEEFTRFNSTYREMLIDMDPESGGHMLTDESADFTTTPAGMARIYFHKWEGLSPKNKPAWHKSFSKGMTSRYGTPQVAVVSLVNWDAAFATRGVFAMELRRLLDYIERDYAPETEIVLRLGQYHCCRSDHDPPDTRGFSRLRVEYFNQYFVNAFAERFGASRSLHVWDVATITERRQWSHRNESTDCNANHARAEIVETENQVLMNAMCN